MENARVNVGKINELRKVNADVYLTMVEHLKKNVNLVT